MSSGFSGGPLAADVRQAAEAAVAGDGVRFDNGVERPLGAKGRRTRAAILRGAGDAFVELGWTTTTVNGIAERAGVGTGTIYQYFRTKEDMLAALVGEWTLAALGQLRTWDSADGREGLCALIQRFVSGYAATAEFQRVWEEASISDTHLAQLRTDLTEVYVRLFADAFVDGQTAGLLDAGPDPVETARALCAMVDRYCHQVFVLQAHRSTPTEVASLLTSIWAAAIHLD
jgi:AcrR family transcriptional regulator